MCAVLIKDGLKSGGKRERSRQMVLKHLDAVGSFSLGILFGVADPYPLGVPLLSKKHYMKETLNLPPLTF